MKKILTVLVMLTIVGMMFAQQTITVEADMEEIGDALEAAGEELGEVIERIETVGDTKTVTITMAGNEASAKRAYLGVYYEDLSLKKARELNYPNNFGVLITGTGAGSAAHKYGIAADDILMEIDGKKCIDKDKFVKIISAYMPEQTVKMKIFSNEVEREFDLTFGHRPEPKKNIQEIMKKKQAMKKKKSYPSVEFMYTPIWYVMDDVEDLNSVFTQMGFSELDEKGTLYNGFAVRANIGKGVYIGGTFAGYSLTRKIKHNISPTGTNPTDHYDMKDGKEKVNTVRRMNFESGWGAVTIDKKFMLAKWLQPSLGVALGGGSQKINFTQTDGGYDWNGLDADFDNGTNNAMTMVRNYFIVQPKADLYIKIIDWLGIRVEGSYMLGYSATKGWTETSGDYLIDNSPDTTMNGYAISVGPWIQF